MTLSELVVATKIEEEISIPSVLKNFEIENAEDFCRYAQGKYLKSIDFKNDLIEILNRLVGNSSLKGFSLQFVKNDNEKLQLTLFDGFDESF